MAITVQIFDLAAELKGTHAIPGIPDAELRPGEYVSLVAYSQARSQQL